MGVFGSIMKFVMITLVSILAVFIVIGVILVVFPSVSLFGLHYISSEYGEESVDYLNTSESGELWDEADIVRVETGGYDIVVRVKTVGQNGELYRSGTYVCVLSGAYNGFAYGGDAYAPTYTSSITQQENITENGKQVFFVRMAEPNGLIVRSSTLLTLIVESDAFENKKLEIVTKSGTVTLGGSLQEDREKLNFSDLKIKADSNSVELKNVEVKNLEVEKTSGDFSTKTNISGSTNISITGGYGIITLNEVGTQDAGCKLTLDTTNTHTTIEKIYGDFEFTAQRGFLETGEITGEVQLNLGSCECKLGAIDGTLTVSGGEGYIKSPSVSKEVNLNVSSADVTLDETLSNVEFVSERGGLTLKKACGAVSCETEYGSIDITCASDSPLTIKNKHGSTKFSGASGVVDISISSNGTGSVTGSFSKVDGYSKIVGYAGNINLTVPQNESWLLSWRNISGKTNVNIGSLQTDIKTTSKYLNDTSGSEDKWIDVLNPSQSADSSNANKLLVTNNSGGINIVSTV